MRKRQLKPPTIRTVAIEEALRLAAKAEIAVLLAELDDETPEREPARRYLRPLCAAITEKGQPCAARAAPTGVLCRFHAALAKKQKSRP
jgi:hypothetical protein